MKNRTLPILLILSFFLLFITGILQAQEVKAVLKDGDIEHFIKTFKPMTAELDALGHDFEDGEENEDEDPTAVFANMRAEMSEILAEKEVKAILEKYDWDENYIDIYIATSVGYYYNKITNEMAKMDESEKAMTKPMMDLMLDQFRLLVHKKDLALLQPHMTALDAVFEE